MIEINNPYKNKIWTAIRFILVAIPGVLIFVFASVFFAVSLFDHTGKYPSPILTGLFSVRMGSDLKIELLKTLGRSDRNGLT